MSGVGDALDAAPIAVLLGRVLAEVTPIPKGRENREQHFKFRGIDDVSEQLHPILAKHGIVPIPIHGELREESRGTRSGGSMNAVRLQVTTRFVGPRGDYIDAVTWGEGADVADKSTSKAASVALRTALLHTFLIPTGDPDPDVSSEAAAGEPTTRGRGSKPLTGWIQGMVIELSKAAAAAGVNADDLRHAACWKATDGRTGSSKELTDADGPAVTRIVQYLKGHPEEADRLVTTWAQEVVG